MLGYFEHASSRLFGHEISQVILLHDNALNADSLDQLLAMLQSRGYRFVTLGEALQDTYLGSEGFSSILRWAEGENMLMLPRPAEPAVIRNLYAQIATK
jgi:hypothetical protein